MATKKKKSKTTEQKTNDKPNELTDKKEKKNARPPEGYRRTNRRGLT